MPRSRSSNVAGSPAGAAETIIAALTGMNVLHDSVIDVEATCDVTIGTTGNAATLRIRRGTDTSGLLIATFGPFTVVAANRVNLTCNATDSQALEVSGSGYVVTLAVAAATAASAVNAVYIGAIY